MNESDGQVIERLTRENMFLHARLAQLEAIVGQSRLADVTDLHAELERRAARVAQLEQLLDDAAAEIIKLKSSKREY